MSLLRYMMNDLRPLVRMLDEPLLPSRVPSVFPSTSSFVTQSPFQQLMRDPFFQELRQPALEVHEDPAKKEYLVEAELPGVKKEDVEVRIAEGGRGLTIEGKVVRKSGLAKSQAAPEAASATSTSEGTAVANTSAETAVQPSEQPQWETYESTFSRSIAFPKPVNPEGVVAKLENGVLSLRVPQAEERGSVRVDVL